MLNAVELNHILAQIFGYSDDELGRRIGFLVDVPAIPEDDTENWRARRALVMRWARTLNRDSLHHCVVYAYESLDINNPLFDQSLHNIDLKDEVPDDAAQLAQYAPDPTEAAEVYSRAECWIALTQSSATLPLKQVVSQLAFRAVTLTHFESSFIPALQIDAQILEMRLQKLAHELNDAHTAILKFRVKTATYTLNIDLRYRIAFADAVRFTRNGLVGCLPAGEAYTVPYEGEKIGIISITDGILPLQNGLYIALCEVQENRIVCIDGENEWSKQLRAELAQDPARTNIAELGFGILAEWNIAPTGNLRIDEKLSPHIALGRSEHIGGVTSPADFLCPENVTHRDFIFHRDIMPDIAIESITLIAKDRETRIMQADRYLF